MSELGKPFLKNLIQKNKKREKKCQNVAIENKKPLMSNGNLVPTKI